MHWWHHDTDRQRITPLKEPQVDGTVINIEPGGQDDTDTILSAARQAGFGGMVLGNGQPFKVRLMRVTTPGVTFKNIPMEPYVSAGS